METDRESDKQRAKQKDSERNTQIPGESRGSEIRIPKERGGNRSRKGSQETRALTDRDTNMLAQRQRVQEPAGEGDVATEAGRACSTCACAVATLCVAVHVCWDVRVHTFVCKRQWMLKQACSAGARHKQPWQTDSPCQQPGAAVDFSLAATQSEYHEIPHKIWAVMCLCQCAGRGAHPPRVPSLGPAAACGLHSPWLQTPSRRQGLHVWKRTWEPLLGPGQTLSVREVCPGRPVWWLKPTWSDSD